MYKMAFVIVTLLLVILASNPQAQAATLTATDSGNSTGSKISGSIISNPEKTQTMGVARGLSLETTSNRYSDSSVRVYDVWFNMVADTDGDGYYHQFEVNFDIDSELYRQDIYVVGELAGASRQILFQTETYMLSGDSGDDTYQARVLLTEGYPSQAYELILNIYSAETDSLLLQYDGDNDSRLRSLFLEDNTQEEAGYDRVTLYELGFELSADQDGDGFYTQLEVELDADAPGQERNVYVRLSLIDGYGRWYNISTSNLFRLYDYSSNDRYTTRVVLDYGFDPATYQLGVEIFDAETENLLLSSTAPSTTPLTMESTDWDNDWDNDYSVTVEEEYRVSGSGGSSSLFLLFLLGLFLLAAHRNKSNK
ncbi:MAG: hypothetical protein CSH49_10145 [Alcanivorax sp.]|jgi:hypothetical protein|nr:choice-of-anchor H family protein [Pseudomonadota bacterium]TNC88758.1 MAG: hypothetical protein CSH49_10145 [Alcanivorax sp.]